jgi:hydrogenase/urease accessory protein HupE
MTAKTVSIVQSFCMIDVTAIMARTLFCHQSQRHRDHHYGGDVHDHGDKLAHMVLVGIGSCYHDGIDTTLAATATILTMMDSGTAP